MLELNGLYPCRAMYCGDLCSEYRVCWYIRQTGKWNPMDIDVVSVKVSNPCKCKSCWFYSHYYESQID